MHWTPPALGACAQGLGSRGSSGKLADRFPDSPRLYRPPASDRLRCVADCPNVGRMFHGILLRDLHRAGGRTANEFGLFGVPVIEAGRCRGGIACCSMGGVSGASGSHLRNLDCTQLFCAEIRMPCSSFRSPVDRMALFQVNFLILVTYSALGYCVQMRLV
jgi:hypothetical protein